MLLQWQRAAAAAKSRANAQKNTPGPFELEPFWCALAAEGFSGPKRKKKALELYLIFLDHKSSAVFIFFYSNCCKIVDDLLHFSDNAICNLIYLDLYNFNT